MPRSNRLELFPPSLSFHALLISSKAKPLCVRFGFAADEHSCRAINDYSLSRDVARAAFPLFPPNSQPKPTHNPLTPPTSSQKSTLSLSHCGACRASFLRLRYRRDPCRQARAAHPSHNAAHSPTSGACARAWPFPSQTRLRLFANPASAECWGAPPHRLGPRAPGFLRSPANATRKLGGGRLSPAGVNRPLGRMRPLIADRSGTHPLTVGVSALPGKARGSRLGFSLTMTRSELIVSADC